MVASEDNAILEIFLNRCFSNTAAKYIYFKNSWLHIFHISYFDVMLKSNKFLWSFLGKGFNEKCKQTELALNFNQNSILARKNTFSVHYSSIATLWTSKKLFFKSFIVRGYSETSN